jgi:orotate phosphoribosyltransferase
VSGGRKVAIYQKDGKIFGPTLRGLRVFIVDDVVHSGRRLQTAAEAVRAEGGIVAGYVCIVDRSAGVLKSPAATLGAPLWSAFQADME